MKMKLLATLLIFVSLMVPALAQTQTQPQIGAAIDAAYAVGLQTGQRVAEALRADDDRLKFVLDDWLSPAQQRVVDLEVWIKRWCGDKLGCAAPALADK